ncbi:MAG: pyruvate ferredoxin oxidoreductase [Planctomycetota bacterium]|nr:MAG: pyruvate ferredoxin oxidoreductase [Planctomycetota bacterium]
MPAQRDGDAILMTVELLSANHAAARAAALAGRANRAGRGFGGGVYPITPQTECIELLCRQEFEKGEIVRVESEHSAMAVCMGVSLGGARAFTASSSNGLAYMAENVVSAALYRLPIVMMAVNRTLGPPWNIWVDHGDTLMLRDAGWIQFYCEDNQEVADTILLAYRLAEDARVLLPVMVCQDAFVLSHTMMLTDLPSQEEVDAFLPPLELPHAVGGKPVTVGGLDFPHETEVHRREHHEAMLRVPAVYGEIQDEFERRFGRRPADRVEAYRMDDAEAVFVSMGTTASTAKAVVDAARERGVKAGSLRVRMFRPFPEDLLATWLRGRERVAVLDRDLCPGLGGVLWSEVRGVCPGSLVQNYMLGLGGGDIRPEHLEQVLDDLLARAAAGEPRIVEVG